MTDPAPARMVSVLDALDEVEAHLWQPTLPTDSTRRCRLCGGNDWYASSVQHKPDCPFAIVAASLTPPAPIAAPAQAEAEQAIETLLMQGRGSVPTTYDLVLTARADSVKGMVGVLTAIAYNINHAGDREGHEENEYVGYLFKMLSPAQALAPAEGAE